MSISVVIPTYKDWDRLKACLAALEEQTIEKSDFEIIIANNDPLDPAPPYDLPVNAKTIMVQQPGSYAARNAAVEIATGQIIAFTDSDCVPDKMWLEAARSLIAKSPTARISGQVSIFRPARGSKLAHNYEFHTAFRQLEYAARGEGATANLIVGRETFLRVGLFNELLMSGGDFEWHRRAQVAGVPIMYSDQVIIQHPSRGSLREIFLKRRRTARAEAQFHATTTWEYVKFRLKPPFGRVKYDRGIPTKAVRLQLFFTMYLINVYAAYNFVLVRLGLLKTVRS